MAANRAGNGRPKSVFVIDGQPILHLGLASIVEDDDRLYLAGAARTVEQAAKFIGQRPPSLFVVGMWFADHTGLDVVHRVQDRWSATPILVLSCYDEMVFAERALRAGAQGYIMTNALPEQIVAAMTRVLAGEIYVSDHLASHIVQTSVCGRTSEGDLSCLSDRELEVFELIARRRSVHEIADMLSRSVKTIETHREHIKLKLGIHTSRELSQHAAQWLIDPTSAPAT